jgi:hypothetical protein
MIKIEVQLNIIILNLEKSFYFDKSNEGEIMIKVLFTLVYLNTL